MSVVGNEAAAPPPRGCWLQAAGDCAERISVSVAPEQLSGACRLNAIKSRRVAGRFASAPACRCRLDNTRGIAPGLPIRGECSILCARRERATGYQPQVPLYLESASDSVAPEHLPGARRLSSATFRRVSGIVKPVCSRSIADHTAHRLRRKFPVLPATGVLGWFPGICRDRLPRATGGLRR